MFQLSLVEANGVWCFILLCYWQIECTTDNFAIFQKLLHFLVGNEQRHRFLLLYKALELIIESFHKITAAVLQFVYIKKLPIILGVGVG